MNDQAAEISSPIMKVFAAWASVGAAIGIQTWAQAASFATFCASMVAAIYTMCLLLEFIWKRVLRPLCVVFGWVRQDAGNSTD